MVPSNTVVLIPYERFGYHICQLFNNKSSYITSFTPNSGNYNIILFDFHRHSSGQLQALSTSLSIRNLPGSDLQKLQTISSTFTIFKLHIFTSHFVLILDFKQFLMFQICSVGVSSNPYACIKWLYRELSLLSMGFLRNSKFRCYYSHSYYHCFYRRPSCIFQ